jgi:hypothetical protein
MEQHHEGKRKQEGAQSLLYQNRADGEAGPYAMKGWQVHVDGERACHGKTGEYPGQQIGHGEFSGLVVDVTIAAPDVLCCARRAGWQGNPALRCQPLCITAQLGYPPP